MLAFVCLESKYGDCSGVWNRYRVSDSGNRVMPMTSLKYCLILDPTHLDIKFSVLIPRNFQFSLLYKSVLVSSAVACFLICSIKVNSACCWKLWFCSMKCLHAEIEACELASFLWLLRRMLRGISLFPTFWSLHIRLAGVNRYFFCR